MATIRQDRGTRFNITNSFGTAGTLTFTPGSTQIAYITDFSISTDKAFGTMTIYTTGTNGTNVFQARITNNNPFDADFIQPLTDGVVGNSLNITTTGSVNCWINMSGFTINTP